MNNKANIEFGFRRIRRILQISEGIILGLLPLWITVTLLDLQNSSYPTQPHPIISNNITAPIEYVSMVQRFIFLFKLLKYAMLHYKNSGLQHVSA